MATSALAAVLTVIGMSALLIVLLYGLILISRQWKRVLEQRVVDALKKRRNKSDKFREVNGYSWDYMIVFQVYDEIDNLTVVQCDFSMKNILQKLSIGGLQIRLFYSIQHKEVYCKVRCPLQRLQKHADLIDYKLLLDREELRKYCTTGTKEWEPLKIPEKSDLTTLDPYEYIYCRYEYSEESGGTDPQLLPLYKRWPKTVLNGENASKYFPTVAAISTDKVGSTRNPLANRDDHSNSGSSVDSEGERTGHEVESVIFRGVDRLKLIHMIITDFGIAGCHLDPMQLLKDRCILAYSPLHDMVELRALQAEWIQLLALPWNQPVFAIKDYFGEKIGLYFVWLGQYTSWLIIAAFLGFLTWIFIAVENNDPSAPTIPYFAGFMGLWSSLFLEFWKRKEKYTALQWGMIGFEEEEQTRPRFEGEIIKSSITGRPTKYFPRLERSRRTLVSSAIIAGLILLVIGVLACIFSLRIAMQKANFIVAGVEMASIVASILIAIQIQVLNAIFTDVALTLNEYENHRTETEYEDALIGKTYCFQFVNSFASLFYISFVKPFIPAIDQCIGSCMLELQTTLGTIFLTRLALGNFTELCVPMIKSYFDARSRKKAVIADNQSHTRLRSEFSEEGVRMSSIFTSDSSTHQDDGRDEVSEIEKAFTMANYDVLLGTFEDYAEMAIQFGYTTMFVAGFPLATVMSLVSNYVEIRVDAWKLCQLSRRPEPRGIEDIGTWYSILEITAMAAVFINSGIVAITAGNTINYTWVERTWIFIMMATGLFCIRLIVAYIIPDVPTEVQIQLDRQDYILGKILDNIQDEDDSYLTKNIFLVPNFLIKETDDDPL